MFIFWLRVNLHSSTRDEEPLVNAAINGSRGKVLAARDASKLGGVDSVGVVERGVGTIQVSPRDWHAMGKHDNLQVDVAAVSLSGDELLPRVGTLVDNLFSVPAEIRYGTSYHLSETHFLFLASPEKANWFSGLPSGIL